MRSKLIENNLRMISAITIGIFCLVMAPTALLAEEESFFNNSAQAQKAENLAEISATMAETELAEAESSLEAAESSLATADEALHGITETINAGLDEIDQLSEEQLATVAADDPDAALQDIVDTINLGLNVDDHIEVQSLLDTPEAYGISAAQLAEVQNYSTTQSNLEQAQADLESALASASGVSVAEIADMRASGLGWGLIAHDLGIHPSALGLGNKYGHTKTNRSQSRAFHGYGKHSQMSKNTMRSLTGKALGHSKANKDKEGNNSGGLGKANGKDNQGARGNSGGRGGNAGSNGGGNGNGGGNSGGKK